MLILPVFNKKTKSLPLCCITLIFLNAIIFFGPQSGDTSRHAELIGYYQSSGLLDLELDAYLIYLQQNGEEAPEGTLENQGLKERYVEKMFDDEAFQEKLDEERIITPESRNYDEWRQKRDNLEKMSEEIITFKYGYTPKENNFAGLFCYMFLHGSFMHLLGNMVFLWFVGAILEKALGGVVLLPLYLITGICAGSLFGFVYPESPVPLIGASGAIAGLMGAYGVIFVTRRIRVFYSLGFFFSYANMPALVLLPIWLAKEFWQLYLTPESNVAYVAHIGGLLSGAIIGFGLRQLRKEKIEELFREDEQKNTIQSLLDKGTEKLGQLDMKAARSAFERVLVTEPRNLIALRQLFHIDKTTPEQECFHQSTFSLLQALPPEACRDYITIFEEYRKITKPRFNTAAIERLITCYLSGGNLEKAQSYTATLNKMKPDNAKVPGFLFRLIREYKRQGNTRQAEKVSHVLQSHFPDSAEKAQLDLEK